MAKYIIKLEKEDIETNFIGVNFYLQTTDGIQIVFSKEAIEELIEDYNLSKLPKKNLLKKAKSKRSPK